MRCSSEQSWVDCKLQLSMACRHPMTPHRRGGAKGRPACGMGLHSGHQALQAVKPRKLGGGLGPLVYTAWCVQASALAAMVCRQRLCRVLCDLPARRKLLQWPARLASGVQGVKQCGVLAYHSKTHWAGQVDTHACR